MITASENDWVATNRDSTSKIRAKSSDWSTNEEVKKSGNAGFEPTASGSGGRRGDGDVCDCAKRSILKDLPVSKHLYYITFGISLSC